MAMPVFARGHYHWHLRKIRRSQGHAVTAASAYRTGTSIVDLQSGVLHDYTRRFGVIETCIYLPPGAPERFFKRQVLWNEAEKSEKRKDAVVGREIDFGLPHQLSPEGRRRAGERMAQYLVDRYGVAVEIAWHMPSNVIGHDQRNFHCHALFTSRRITPEGFGEKTAELDDYFMGPAEVELMRRAWQEIANAELEREGINVRIDCRSLIDQGINDRLPQIHEGVVVRAMLDRGVDPAEIQKLHGRPASTEANDNGNRLKKRIPYEQLDKGRNRVQYNGGIKDLNEWVDEQGPVSLQEQIVHCDYLLEKLAEKITNLQALIPLHMLPAWLQIKLERYRLALLAAFAKFVQDKEEAEEERRYRDGIHQRIRELLYQKKQIEEQRRHKEALQRLYRRIEHHLIAKPQVYLAPGVRPATRELSNKQFSIELHFKAETARAKVIPEYRPKIERPAPAGQGGHSITVPKAEFKAAVSAPPDNGGLAKRPPALKGNFNGQADPAPEPAYRQKVKVAFGAA